jgi:hypothetical protein
LPAHILSAGQGVLDTRHDAAPWQTPFSQVSPEGHSSPKWKQLFGSVRVSIPWQAPAAQKPSPASASKQTAPIRAWEQSTFVQISPTQIAFAPQPRPPVEPPDDDPEDPPVEAEPLEEVPPELAVPDEEPRLPNAVLLDAVLPLDPPELPPLPLVELDAKVPQRVQLASRSKQSDAKSPPAAARLPLRTVENLSSSTVLPAPALRFAPHPSGAPHFNRRTARRYRRSADLAWA